MSTLAKSIRLFEHALIFDFERVSNIQPPSCNRGKINSLSFGAVRRLREALAIYHIPFATTLGVTLTVPWRKPFEGCFDLYRKVFNVWQTSFRRAFPTVGGIFRHELQSRKMPHCHIVFYVPSYVDIDEFQGRVFSLWLRSVPIRDGSLRSFSKYGVNSKILDRLPGVFRYLADHASKHKQSQLGYEGKQWGIIGKKNLVLRSSSSCDLSPAVARLVVRQLSRIYRYCRKADCVFGYRHLKRRTIAKVCFFTPSTVLRVVSYYENFFKIPPCALP